MSHISADFRHSVRLLARAKGFSAVAVLILGLGIGANTTVFSVVNTLVLQPRPGRIETLVSVFSRDRERANSFRDFSYPLYLDLRGRRDVFDGLLAHTFSLVGIGDGEAMKRAFVEVVSANYFSTLGVRLAAGREFTADEERPGTNATIQRELRQLDSRLPVLSARTMTTQRDVSLTHWAARVAAVMFSTFGALALLLAAIGVYGLRAYDVARRTREIGIRIALGATTGNVAALVLRDGLWTTGAGLIAGFLLALGLGQVVSGLLYEVSPFDPLTMAVAAAALSGATLLATYFPARRATRIAPLEALRTE